MVNLIECLNIKYGYDEENISSEDFNNIISQIDEKYKLLVASNTRVRSEAALND